MTTAGRADDDDLRLRLRLRLRRPVAAAIRSRA
jgi:hypothetical protein